MQPLPIVSIVGRPNVGKSTLFNRLVGRRQAIVHDQPGVTRDRLAGRFQLADEWPAQLVDTGGLVLGDDPMGLGEQVFLAVDESDLLLLVVDGREGLVAADEKIWAELRRRGKAAVLVVNKGDTRAAEEGFEEFYRLGIGPQVLVSAEHGRGFSELFELMREELPAPQQIEPDPEVPAVAIVGRPNVGKSSLVNRLLGKARVLVSPIAGTTRDPIDSLLEVGDRRYKLIDTAGIRRRSQVTGAAEDLAVMFARRQMERADLVVLVVDAASGVTSGDMTIAGQAWELGRAVVVVLNKWDLLDELSRENLDNSWPRLEELLSGPPRVNMSATSGRHAEKLMPAVDAALERFRVQLTTSVVNRLFERATQLHQAPQLRGRPWRLYYATQVATAPPTFMLFANRTLERSDTYRRYLENRVRAELDLAGIPIRLVIRRR